jgi:DNA-binding MarR family transcriptional regulator
MDYFQVQLKEAERFDELLHAFLRQMIAGGDESEDMVKELPLAQLRLCHALGKSPRSMSELSRELGTSLSAITQIADRLERAGLVQRMARDDDRRIRCLCLTDHGQQMMRKHGECRVRRMQRVLERLGPDERQSAAATLAMMLEAAQRANGGSDATENSPPHFATAKVLL